MPQKRGEGTDRKIRVEARIERGLYEWVNQRTGTGLRFHNWAHALESAIQQLKKAEK